MRTHTPWEPQKLGAVFIMDGKNKNREKYGGISQNPPLYPGHNNPE
jgi:hypothetical protein